MPDLTSAPAGEGTPSLASTPAEYTPHDLGNLFAEARQKPDDESTAESADTATADTELAKANGDPEKAPAEVAEATEPTEELSPIDPPRSWTQAEKERFQSLPRETQEYLHTREQEREREFRRGQNELAEQRKAILAEQEAAAKARQQYEAQLPALMQELQNAQAGSFADVRTVDDVQRLASEDPFRYLQWQAHQTKLQAVNAELERASREKQTAEQSKWAQHVNEENAKAAEYIPELADKVKGPALTNRVATELLPELGFKESELNALASGNDRLSIYDHRVQRLLADALKLRDIQKAKVVAAPKSVPPVQRPGIAKPPGSTSSETIQNLSGKLERSGDPKDLSALIGALRRA